MRQRISKGFIPAMVAVLTLGACASGGMEDTAGALPAANVVPVEVSNDLLQESMVDVFIVDREGVEYSLGQVAPNRTETFYIDAPVSEGDYRLVAVKRAGGDTGRLNSDWIPALHTRLGLDWHLGENELSLR